MFIWTILKNLPTYLLQVLAIIDKEVIRLSSSHLSLQEQSQSSILVFDVANCGPNFRFKTSTGLISHNCVLGLSYGLGPKNLQKQLFEKGLDFDLKTCKEAFDNYWKLFSDVKRFGKIKEYEFERNGYVVTGLGFRVIPDAGYKAFNNFIQGTSAGVIHCFCEYIVKFAPYAQIQVTIHDEAVIQVSEDRLEDLRLAVKQATECLNSDLNWDIPIRSGFVVGKDWYEAK